MARKKKVEEMEFEGDEPGLPDVLDEQPEPEAEPEPESESEEYNSMPDVEPRDVPDFPLDEGHYFHTPVLSPRGHSEHSGVAVLRAHLGVEPVDSEVFDSDLFLSVQSFQKSIGEPMSGVVDAEVWEEIFSR